MSIRPYWQVVPLQETTGRTLLPVPPVSRPAARRSSRRGSMLSKGTCWISRVSREVMVTSPLPYFSAASVMARISSAVILPLRVMTRPLKQSGVRLSQRKPSPFTRVTSSGGTVAPGDFTRTSLKKLAPSSTRVLV